MTTNASLYVALPPAPPTSSTYIPVLGLYWTTKQTYAQMRTRAKSDGTDGLTNGHTKKGASPTPPKPVLGFTTLGQTIRQTDRQLILVGLV
jgi:hypothetical protein